MLPGARNLVRNTVDSTRRTSLASTAFRRSIGSSSRVQPRYTFTSPTRTLRAIPSPTSPILLQSRNRCACAHHLGISTSTLHTRFINDHVGEMATGGIEADQKNVALEAQKGDAGKVRDKYRLPTSVHPSHYDLIFKTDLEALSFEGEGLIQLDVLEDTKSIVFNLDPKLQLTHIRLITPTSTVDYPPPAASPKSSPSSAKKALPPVEGEASDSGSEGVLDLVQDIVEGQVKVDKEQERMALGLRGEGIKAGTKGVILKVGWKGPLRDDMAGFYRSSWTKDGKTAHYALTQFEPTAARNAYPAWDEPLLKSTYSISLVGRKGLVSLSNMPEKENGKRAWGAEGDAIESDTEGQKIGAGFGGVKEGEWEVVEFQKTPLVSSYLVAFANGEFASLSSSYKSPLSGKTIPLKIYTTPDLIHQAQFALDVKAAAMPVYEEVFDIEYPLPKLDTLVASDFDAGAMENWGLITGRTSAFLLDPKKSSLSAKKRVIDVMSHECAHMWFGNIVSPKWWDNLWLNEAFATLAGEVTVPDRIFPEFKVRQEFLVGHLSAALSLDSVRSSHAIEVPCPDANQINQIFDSISYSKGGSVLNMLSNFIGEKVFLKGVSLYLKKRLYGNAETGDLWEGIQEASGIDIPAFMKNWILKVGHPVLSVVEVDGKLRITQNRFLINGDVKPEEDETIWNVPLEVKTVKDGVVSIDHKAVLTERETTYDLKGAQAFKLNANTTGVYRVAYSSDRLGLIGDEAANPEGAFNTEDRIGLVSDAITLARSGSGKTSGALNLISKLGREPDYRVWSSIGSALTKLRNVWWEEPEDVRKAIDQLRRKLYKPLVDKLGFEFGEDDSPETKELRGLALSMVSGTEDPEIIAECQRRFKPFLETGDDSLIHPDIQGIIYSVAVRYGSAAEWDKMRSVHDNPPNPSTKIDALFALGATRVPELLERAFAMLSDGSIKDQDIMYGFVSLSSNRLSRRQVAKYFYEHYDELFDKFNNNFALNRLVQYSFNSLTAQSDIDEMAKFFADKDTSKYKLSLAQTQDSMLAANHWLNRDREDVKQWLIANQYL